MSKTTEKIVKIPAFSYQTPGALGIQTSSSHVDWYTCRDAFHGQTEHGILSFLFYHHGPGVNVIEFLRVFEEAVNVPVGQEIQFKKTSNPSVLWVGMSEWWKYRVRRSLLTALLRAGQNYINHTGDGFQKALNSYNYLRETKDALEYFMSGHTAVKMKKNVAFPGWYHFFTKKPRNQIEACLVKLKRRRKEQPPEQKV